MARKPSKKTKRKLPELWLIALPLAGAALGAILASGTITSHQELRAEQRSKESRPHRVGNLTVEDRTYELVVEQDAIEMYILKSGKRVPQAEGSVTVSLDDMTPSIELRPLGGKAFVARGNFDVERAKAASAIVTFPNRKPETLRFTLK